MVSLYPKCCKVYNKMRLLNVFTPCKYLLINGIGIKKL